MNDRCSKCGKLFSRSLTSRLSSGDLICNSCWDLDYLIKYDKKSINWIPQSVEEEYDKYKTIPPEQEIQEIYKIKQEIQKISNAKKLVPLPIFGSEMIPVEKKEIEIEIEKPKKRKIDLD